MYGYDEVLATFVPDASPFASADGVPTAAIMVRSASGQWSLQPLDPDGTLGQHALSTGAFRKGQPIVDPVSRRILGYEMEPLGNALDAARRAD